jgi:predicted XRE-type DNA-binding protein
MTTIEKGSTNVYRDLESPEADTMCVKACLAARIWEIIKDRQLTLHQAAGILGLPQPKLYGMLQGKFRGISETKMISCLNRLDRDTENK